MRRRSGSIEPSHEKASHVVWLAISSEMPLLRPAQLPAYHRSRRPYLHAAMAFWCRSNAGAYRRMVASQEVCFRAWATYSTISLASS